MKKAFLQGMMLLCLLMIMNSCVIMIDDPNPTPYPTAEPTAEPTIIPQGSIEIVNISSTWVIVSAYISETNSSEWGDDQLGADVIMPLNSRTFDVNPGLYDVMIYDDFGEEFYIFDVSVDSWSTVSLYYNGNEFEQ
jgi:hypothetical protein